MPVSVFAAEGSFSASPFSVTVYDSSYAPYELSFSEFGFPSSLNFPDLFGNSSLSYASSFPRDAIAHSDFSISLSTSVSGLNYTDLVFSFDPRPFFGYILFSNERGLSYDYSSLSYSVSGSVVVSFSDGTSETIDLTSHLPSSGVFFSAKKQLFSNEYIMTSEDFNLSSNSEHKVSLSASEAVTLSTKFAALSGYGTFSGNDTKLYSITDLTGLGHYYVYVPDAIFPNSSINTLGTGDFVVSAANLSISSADLLIEKGVVSPSVVTLDKNSPDVFITGFSVNLTINFPFSYLSSFLDIANPSYYFPSGFDMSSYWGLYGVFWLNFVFYYSDSSGFVARISNSLDDIYLLLRYELPLTLRHIVIPTQEEVDDVIDEAIEDIKNNAGGLGESLTIAENAFNSVSDMLTGSTASGLVLPALDVNINGTVYRLWEDFDFMPYINSEPVQQIMDFVSIFLQALLTLYFVNHLRAMWEALLCGNSYVGMLRYLRFEDEEEISKSFY